MAARYVQNIYMSIIYLNVADTLTTIVERFPGIGYDTLLFSEQVDVKILIFRVKFAVPTWVENL